MGVRRVVTHKGKTLDGEELQILTIFEESITKEQLKKMNGFSKNHYVLVNKGGFYRFKEEA